jgi:alcohol dehydrogenase (cytochrome c)
MTIKKLLVAAALAASPVVLVAQGRGLDPAKLLKPLADEWPTYSGDYSSKRYSLLKQINQLNVKHLTLAWTLKLTGGSVSGSGGDVFGGGRGGASPNYIIGGEGTGDYPAGGPPTIKASALMVDGTIYLTAPDNAWAIDARDGRVLWHYFWKSRGGTHIATRGFGMWKDYLYMETPDNYLVSLEAKTGKERWHKVISDFSQQYFSTAAPVVIGNHVIAGTGNDLDMPGFLQSFDPETGELQWKLYTVPMNPGDPGVDSWPSLDAARHGGAQPWLPGAYDPETNLYMFGTGNPTPAYTPGRGEEHHDNLFTGSLIAVNVDTGKMAWYYQTAPHDMHDWDSAQTPVLVNALFKGRMRKMVMTAARNGYFFVIDRVTGEHLLTEKYGSATNWVKNLDEKDGRDVMLKRTQRSADQSSRRALVEQSTGSRPRSHPTRGCSMSGKQHLLDLLSHRHRSRGSMGLGGKLEARAGTGGSFLTALDYRTGKAAWRYKYEGGAGGGGGILATAGKLVFAGDGAGNIVAHDAATGKVLWHSKIGGVTNPPQTYMLDGRQYLLVATNDTLWAFVMY